MVFFTCNHCGESLKKAAVEKHYQFKSCRNGPIFLTCVDCLKDFREQEYVAHIKCITEAERYAAKGTYTSKPDKNKGAQKQEAWTEVIQELAERRDIDNSMRNILQRIATQSNVPRKKPKFINFLKSSMKYSPNHAEKVWTIIEKGLEEFKNRTAPAVAIAAVTKEVEAPAETTNENGNDNNTISEQTNGATTDELISNGHSNDLTLEKIVQHALAQDSLEKSVKKSLKKLAKQSDIPLNAKPPKKKKFIKLLQETLELDAENSGSVWETISASIDALGQIDGKQNDVTESNGCVANGNAKKRKNNSNESENENAKKPRVESNGNDNGNVTTELNSETNDDSTMSFDWQKNIVKIFDKNQTDNQLSIESLRSKVIKKFLKSLGEDGTNSEQYNKKFKKQLKKIDNFVTAGDVVQLKT